MATSQRQARQTYQFEKGWPHPLGAVPDAEGVSFTLFSQHATGVELLLFDNHDDAEPSQVFAFDPNVNKTFHFWHAYVRGLKPGAHYAYRIDGPNDAAAGHRFNRNKVLIDPYSKGTTNTLWDRGQACGADDNLHASMRSVVINLNDYDWENDSPLRRPMAETVIYEMHVGGFTRSASAGSKAAGTYSAIIEKIPYLKSLGVTAVELLPVFGFDSKQVLRQGADGEVLKNYWGYSTISYFAPESSFCLSPESGSHINEFRDMVKALHRAGIEVILDVVFNHTDEGNHQGPMINFRGIDNSIYYHLVPGDKQYYMDYSGCGNTFNCNHPVVEKLIVECLEFWVREMHVDGFRFDEGSILSRGMDGQVMHYPPVTWAIELSETLADAKIIAEAWDAAGAYQVGHFPGYRWAEWNGRFRDDVRRFVRGDRGIIGAVASRIAGSSDIYQSNGHLPINSINFVTCHDGFTLNDLVSYNAKHNEANGENNQDGINDNLSWNCGVEGPSDDPAIEAFRDRQIRNFAVILMLSQGVPMITAGDEIRRTQGGNNNAYCQDNEISWFDWNLAEKNAGLLRFYQRLIAFRRGHPVLQRSRFFTGEENARGLRDIAWHGCELHSPGWNDPNSAVLAFTLGGFDQDADLHVMLNMDGANLEFQLPAVAGRRWHRVVDTSLNSPDDIADPGSEISIEGDTYLVTGRSAVVLMSKVV